MKTLEQETQLNQTLKNLFESKSVFLEIDDDTSKEWRTYIPERLRSMRLTEKGLKHLSSMRMPDGSITYAFFPKPDEGQRTDHIYMFNVSEGATTGYCVLAHENMYVSNGERRKIPHIAYTETIAGQGAGKGTTRLWAALQYVHQYYPGETLYSDERFENPRARRIWERLVKVDVAETVVDDDGTISRYRIRMSI